MKQNVKLLTMRIIQAYNMQTMSYEEEVMDWSTRSGPLVNAAEWA